MATTKASNQCHPQQAFNLPSQTPFQLPPPYQHPANGNLLTPFQLPLEKEAELQNWHVVDKFNKMLISFTIVKSKKLWTRKAEVNRFWRMCRRGEWWGWFSQLPEHTHSPAPGCPGTWCVQSGVVHTTLSNLSRHLSLDEGNQLTFKKF